MIDYGLVRDSTLYVIGLALDAAIVALAAGLVVAFFATSLKRV